MPGMDGLEAVSTIKANPATASIPIMMYTAQKGEVYVGQARALGAAGVLPKQIEPVEVSKVLEKLHIIGRNAEHGRRSDDVDPIDVSASGGYPSLDKFDRDLKVLIQELFDQQRAILRRDLLDSQEVIAARVADEIRSPEPDSDELLLLEPERDIPSPVQVIAAIIASRRGRIRVVVLERESKSTRGSAAERQSAARACRSAGNSIAGVAADQATIGRLPAGLGGYAYRRPG